MKTLKIGFINFYTNESFGDSGYYRIYRLVELLNQYTNHKYEFCDNCKEHECDIVFYSLYDKIENLQLVKGNPNFIYWTDENTAVGANKIFNSDPFLFYKNNNLSMSFYDDSNDNIYYPYFALFFDDYRTSLNYKINLNDKNKFCTFCALNEDCYNAQYRTNLVKYISKNYKEITCCGQVLNNTNGKLLPWDLEEKIKYHNNYKFNLCFENSPSLGNLMYITEKIINAYIYKVVPIYWGAERVNEWFNKDSFINCNGLTYDEILEKIKEVDNDNELFNYMINQYPFIQSVDELEKYFICKTDKFIYDHI